MLMNNPKKYWYTVEAFGYDDWDCCILTHNTKFSKEEFQEILIKAREKVSKPTTASKKYKTFNLNDVRRVLIKEYLFEAPLWLCGDLGCNTSDKVKVEYNVEFESRCGYD